MCGRYGADAEPAALEEVGLCCCPRWCHPLAVLGVFGSGEHVGSRQGSVLPGSGCSGCAHTLPNASASSPGLAPPMGATSCALSRALQPPNPCGTERVTATGGLVRGPGDG